MRPAILNPLFSDIIGIKGIGDAVRLKLKKYFHKSDQEHPRVLDLAFHLPVNVVDRKLTENLQQAKAGEVVTLIVEVEKHEPSPSFSRYKAGLKPYRVVCRHPSGFITLTYFNPKSDYLAKLYPIGAKKLVSGIFQKNAGEFQIVHPEIVTFPDQLSKIQRLEPVYGLTYGISQQMMIRYVEGALAKLPSLPEWSDEALLKSRGWLPWNQALHSLHHPKTVDDIQFSSPNRERMAYDELLANQLALAIVRASTRKRKTIVEKPQRHLMQALLDSLPYTLTSGQLLALSEITADMESGYKMLRLLQGDVGCGKTVVALLAMLHQLERGKQAALMVPTEILGRQHLAFITPYAEALGFTVDILTGSMKPAKQQAVRSALAKGEIDIVIGTHSLFQERVAFHRLGLVVVDEQHRFGVEQRLALSDKGGTPHILQMTATPIPRSLTMTAFGDMEVSTIREKPAGRKPIDTRAIPLSRDEEILVAMKRAMDQGNKIYWICPLIEESEDKENTALDLAAAEQRFIEFKARFGDLVGLVHGRMKADQRDEVMSAFASGEYKILVATTVIEVGVNVPDATIMVIEHAERFGLSQLHQLRGRVGRGEKASSCILLYADHAGENARARLKVMRDTEDGFVIAEEDLRIRGGGDVLGTKQSGLPDFRFADLAEHTDLVLIARDDVKLIMHRDPKLSSARGEALRILLYLYEYDANIRYLESG